jgi:hypothetical protein
MSSTHTSDEFPLIMEREFGMADNVAPVAVAFGFYPMLDGGATKRAGHEVYKDVEHVKVVVPGDRHSLFFQPASDVYRKRFPKAYEAFKKRDTKPLEGLPIEQWAAVSRSLALTLRACNIHTVEALAAVHDTHVDKLGFNARELREKAKAWLASAKDSASTLALAEEKKALQDQLAAMQAQILALTNGVGAAARGDKPAPSSATVAHDDVQADVVAAARRPRAIKAT